MSNDEMGRAMQYYSMGVGRNSLVESPTHQNARPSHSIVKTLASESTSTMASEYTQASNLAAEKLLLQAQIDTQESQIRDFKSRETDITQQLEDALGQLSVLQEKITNMESSNVAESSPVLIKRSSSGFGFEALAEKELASLKQERATLKQTIMKQRSDANALKENNATLTERIRELEETSAKSASYPSEIDQLKKDMNNMQAVFGAERQGMRQHYETSQKKILAERLTVERKLEEEKVKLQQQHDQKLYEMGRHREVEKMELITKHAEEKKNMAATFSVQIADARSAASGQFDLAKENERLRRALEECNKEISKTKAKDGETSLIEENLSAQLNVITKLEKQLKPTKDRLASAEVEISRQEAQIRSLNAEKEKYIAGEQRHAKAMEDERASFAVQEQKLQKKIDLLSKNLKEQEEAFWKAADEASKHAAAAAATKALDPIQTKARKSIGSDEESPRGRPSEFSKIIQEHDTKLKEVETKLKASNREVEALRTRLKESEVERAKMIKKSRKGKQTPESTDESPSTLDSLPTPALTSNHASESHFQFTTSHYVNVFLILIICMLLTQ